jgi:DNA-binding transcriptional MerR regulator
VSDYNQDPDALLSRAYTSREAAQASGVPFFTVDYWDRTRFLVPTVSPGKGRGKGRQRLYSFGDLVRLRIARELREQRVSLETLRAIVKKLAPATDRLAAANWVLVGNRVETARTATELAALLGRSRRKSFGVVLDLRGSLTLVRKRARALARSRRAAG